MSPGSISPPADVILSIFFVLLVPFGIAGVSLFAVGLGRSRSAAQCMVGVLTIAAIAAIVFCLWGFSLQGYPSLAADVISTGGKKWNWMGRGPALMRGLSQADERVAVLAMLQMFAAILASVIPLAAAMDRWRLRAIAGSTALLAGFTYPVFSQWALTGWLAQLGVQYGLGRGFVDAGGAGSVPVVGGLTALSIVWVIGPRRGKYSHDGLPTAIPGHDMVRVLFGCLLAWVGWIGLNSAAAVLGFGPTRVALIGVNVTLAASAAALTSLLTTRARFGRPDASLTANGWMGGLVAGSAGAALAPPIAAILIGAVAGALVPYAADKLEFWLAIDDAGGAISSFAIAGLWGLLAVTPFTGAEGQWLAQLVGIATLLGFVLPASYGLNWLLNLIWPQRVELDGERLGMDLHELGSGAYPEFVIHSDEFVQR